MSMRMGEKRFCKSLLCFVFLLTVASVNARLRIDDDFIQCLHEKNTNLVYGVQQDSSGRRGKRQTTPQFQPFRVHVYYDNTVDTELDSTQQSRLQNIVIPAVESYIEAALSVIPATSPILLDRDCVSGRFFLPVGPVRRCVTQCSAQTLCVLAQVPEEHLKRCIQCSGSSATCETIGSDGPGVNNTDYILYVGANRGGSCTNNGVLAFANACQLEATLDRPIAGAINFCPDQFQARSDEDNIRIGIHEVIHALGFSPSVYAFFRDEEGNPRTPRDQFGFPPTDGSGGFIASETTIRTTTYTDWQTRNGLIDHDVQQFVTPNVVEQARIHYNCSTLDGVELENQGGGGTSFSHFEQRILGNEGMTGVLLFNIRFSRMTLGLLEDTGWYQADYSQAEPLAWGQNSGCRLPQGSCGEWIQTQQQRGTTLAPYCNFLVQNPARLGCTIDRESVSVCNLIDYGSTAIPAEFQYFNSGPNFDAAVAPRVGGSVTIPDYCGLHLPVDLQTGTTQVCNQAADQPAQNIRAETYGPGSRCIEHGRQWFLTTNEASSTSEVYGGGCYQYSCSATVGVEIHVLGLRFRCNCEGEELIMNITVNGSDYEGSLICPSCAQLCFDDLSLCPDQEPATCYGLQTIAVPITEPLTCYQDAGTCVNEIGQAPSVGECCDRLGGSAYRQGSGPCTQCPQAVTTPPPTTPPPTTPPPTTPPPTTPPPTTLPPTTQPPTTQPPTTPAPTTPAPTTPAPTTPPPTTLPPTTQPPIQCGGSINAGCAGGTCNYNASWMVEGDSVTFTVSARTASNTWVGIGFSDDQLMPNSDVVVGAADASGSFVSDRFAVGRFQPPADASQDISNTAASHENGVTTIQFTRPRTSGDTNDISLDVCRFLLYAWSGSANTVEQTIGYHGGENRGPTAERVCFPSATECPAPVTTPPPTTPPPTTPPPTTPPPTTLPPTTPPPTTPPPTTPPPTTPPPTTPPPTTPPPTTLPPTTQPPIEVGFEQESYEVAENVGDSDLALLVCANTSSDVLVGFTVTVSVQNGTALAGRDFLPSVDTLTFVPGVGSQRQCACVQILQDVEDDDNEQFLVTINTTSPNITITRDSSAVTIVDDDSSQDDFELRWINDTPRVDGNTVTADLAIGTSFQSVMCSVTTRQTQDCSSGSVTFTGLPPNRRRFFTFTVEGIGPAGERVIISRTFRTDTITDCWLHPINDGLTITGDTVRLEWQGTGPSADNRATLFSCVLAGQAENCQSSQGFVRSGLATGSYVLSIRPVDPDCTRRRIERRFEFEIV